MLLVIGYWFVSSCDGTMAPLRFRCLRSRLTHGKGEVVVAIRAGRATEEIIALPSQDPESPSNVVVDFLPIEGSEEPCEPLFKRLGLHESNGSD